MDPKSAPATRAGHDGAMCPDCKLPVKVEAAGTETSGGVTEDVVSYCRGPGTIGCLMWRHREQSPPGQPAPREILGFKPVTVALGAFGLLAAGIAAALAFGKSGRK